MKNQSSPRVKRIFKLVCALLVVVIVTNPSTLFFLPGRAKDALYGAWSKLFGDVGQITNTLHINWISIFQVVVITLFMILVVEVTRFAIEHVKAKSGKSQSILSLVNSYCSYAATLVDMVWLD